MDNNNKNSIELIKVTDLQSSEYSEAMELYNSLFPEEERLSAEQVEEMIGSGVYTLIAARHIALNKIIGFALAVFNKNPKFLFVDNLAIDSSFQGQGYGSLIFTLLDEMQESGSLGFFFEIELPELAVDAEDKITREKRVNFYKRLGCFPMKEIAYKFPIKDQEPLPLCLMFKPYPGVTVLKADTIKEMIKCVYDKIHYDVPNRQEIFNSYTDTICDQFFG